MSGYALTPLAKAPFRGHSRPDLTTRPLRFRTLTRYANCSIILEKGLELREGWLSFTFGQAGVYPMGEFAIGSASCKANRDSQRDSGQNRRKHVGSPQFAESSVSHSFLHSEQYLQRKLCLPAAIQC